MHWGVPREVHQRPGTGDSWLHAQLTHVVCEDLTALETLLILQAAMSFVTSREDAVSMALTATQRLLQAQHLDPSCIGR